MITEIRRPNISGSSDSVKMGAFPTLAFVHLCSSFASMVGRWQPHRSVVFMKFGSFHVALRVLPRRAVFYVAAARSGTALWVAGSAR